MNSRIRRNVIVVGIFIFLMTVLAVVETYALFETNGNSSTNLSIGRWTILLNNIDAVTTRTISLNDFTYVNGSHTDSNYFAPGSSAYFEIVIDATDCDVSVDYDLTIDDSAIEDYPNIYFTIRDMSNNNVLTTNSFSDVINVSAANKVKTIRMTLNWDNNALYDESDTSLIGEDLSFTITAHFEQYVVS